MLHTRRLFAAPLALVVMIAPAWCANPETREYRISGDGRPAGKYTMTIEKVADTIVQSGKADVSIRVLIKNYTYNYQGTETWRNGTLLRAESNTNDDGKGYRLKAEPGVAGLAVSVNGRQYSAPVGVWTTSYWQPPAVRRDGPIKLLDIDNGKIYDARLKVFPPPATLVNGHAILQRLQVSGPVNADLMYDAHDRLVRQETMEGSHRTLIELVKTSK